MYEPTKNILENKIRRAWNATAYNERFAKIAGVFPLKSWYKLATASPAATSVKPATSPICVAL